MLDFVSVKVLKFPHFAQILPHFYVRMFRVIDLSCVCTPGCQALSLSSVTTRASVAVSQVWAASGVTDASRTTITLERRDVCKSVK